jgi:molybdopterin synthase catalytic subunit
VIRLTREPFDPGEALNAFCSQRAATGAVASFVGLARGTGASGPALELEAYPGFTDREIEGFVAKAIERFDLQDAGVVHRIGPIGAGEAIVLVMTAAPHRRAAFEACDYLMDYLKSRAPLWKREFGPDGGRWVEPTEGDLADLARWA